MKSLLDDQFHISCSFKAGDLLSDVRVDAVVESEHDELRNAFSGNIIWRLGSGAEAIRQLAIGLGAMGGRRIVRIHFQGIGGRGEEGERQKQEDGDAKGIHG